MMFGDRRGDVHSGFTMIATVSLRFHNRLAGQIAAMHPDWDDERLFQETRKIMIGIVQNITYKQFIEVLLGTPNDVHAHTHHGHDAVYDPDVDPTISIAFSTAGFRLHTFVPSAFELRDRHYRETGKLVQQHEAAIFRCRALKVLNNA
jgi:peroxidase